MRIPPEMQLRWTMNRRHALFSLKRFGHALSLVIESEGREFVSCQSAALCLNRIRMKHATLTSIVAALAIVPGILLWGQESDPPPTPPKAASGEVSVKPGINQKFLDPKLKVAEWLKRFEVESREVFHARDKILAACNVEPGMAVADVGAGTGLYTRLFSKAVGDEGWVYAVEINPRWLENIRARAQQENQDNITTLLSDQDSVTLPPNSVDRIFLCDTYHHFEFPMTTMATIVSALKPGGELVVVDFERIEGVTREWLMRLLAREADHLW